MQRRQHVCQCDISPDEYERLKKYSYFLMRQYSLWERCEADDLINQTIEEFCGSTQGRHIEFRWAFMKKISFRVAIKMKQQDIRDRELAGQLERLPVKEDSDPLARLYKSELIADIRQRLDDEENELIDLRIEKDLPWEEICRYYHRKDKAVTAATLRKRFERLILRIANVLKQRGIDSGDFPE